MARTEILSHLQIETRIADIFSTAQICKQTSQELRERLCTFLAELNERTPGGNRRYSVELVGYARGFAAAYDRRLMQEQVEFVYRDKAGVIFSTWRQSTHRSTEEFFSTGRGIELGEMEAAHVWRGTDKPFTPWSVPNQDMRDRHAIKQAKADARYSVTKEFCGQATAQWVVRFCGEWVDCRETETEAWKRAADHHAERQKLLKGE